MSAQELRKAAALMRERAIEATPSPWQQAGPGWIHAVDFEHGPGDDVFDDADMHPADVEHLRSSWHPAVALAVAEWLAWTADREDWREENGGPVAADVDSALDVARAYLGGDR